MSKIDIVKIEKAVKDLLIAIGEDPEREGLKETPKRVAKLYQEMLQGINYTNDQIAGMFNKKYKCDTKDIVLIQDIPVFSFCEHHLALMYNMEISIAYIPNGYVLGLSKFARIVDMVCKRLQLQEKISLDIVEVLEKVLDTKDIAVMIKAEHSCMVARGIKKHGSKTKTLTLRGKFKEDGFKLELFNLLNN